MIKKTLLRMLLWSWVVSLPVVLVGGYASSRALDRFITFQVRYDSSPGNVHLTSAMKYEYTRLCQRIRASYLHLLGRRSQLKVIEVFAKEPDLANLASHMPQSGYQYIKALLKIDGRLEKAKIKFRGDYLHHWAFDKKSIRVRTSKEKLFEGIRSFNVQAPKLPEQLNNYLAFQLAESLDLVTPRSELVRLVLNGKNRGVHIMVEQLEELTLRHADLMPADIYRGELVGKDRFTDSGIAHLFNSSSVWDKMAVNNHYPEDSLVPLQRFLELIRDRNVLEAQFELSEIVDIQAWGRFAAFEALAQTKHYHYNHNYRLYYDPWREKIVPIVWDPTGWPTSWRAKQGEIVAFSIIEHELHKALFSNGDFIRARNRALTSFFQSGRSDTFLRVVSDTVALMNKEVYLDPLLHPMQVASPLRVIAAMKAMEETIQRGFHDIESELVMDAAQVNYAVEGSRLLLEVDGMIQVERLQINLKQPISRLPSGTIRYRTRAGFRLSSVGRMMVVNGSSIDLHGGFLSNMKIVRSEKHAHSNKVVTTPGSFQIDFNDLDLEAEIANVKIDFGAGFEPARRIPEIALQPFTELFFPVALGTLTSPVIWSGEIVISGLTRVDSPVVIEQGTQILLEGNAVLIFMNQVHALGTASAPITFKSSSDGDDPWGAVVLHGNGANGSVLQHCNMSNGSGYKTDLQNYTGMLSIHDVKEVVISDCIFQDNHLVDDMVHTVYADVSFLRCTFTDAYSDALDIDISDAIVVDCLFERSGNDAIDLMGSNVQIIGSVMRENGDKGISVGEGSHLFATQNRIVDNAIGVESKDSSIALLFNHEFSNNNQALHAYRKNWRYGDGGYIFLAKSKLRQNEKSITADKYSQIFLFDAYVEQLAPQKRVEYFKVDTNRRSDAVDAEWLPANILSMQSVSEILSRVRPVQLRRVDPDVRGIQTDD